MGGQSNSGQLFRMRLSLLCLAALAVLPAIISSGPAIDWRCGVRGCVRCNKKFTKCKECGPGLKLTKNKKECKSKCKVADCALCKGKKKCIRCKDGFDLDPNGKKCHPLLIGLPPPWIDKPFLEVDEPFFDFGPLPSVEPPVLVVDPPIVDP